MDDLKELDLRTAEKSCLIEVSSLLTPEEDRSTRTCLHGVILKCQGLIPKSQSINYPSRGVSRPKSNLNDVFA